MTTTTSKKVTDATFDAEVLKADGPVLVDFWATWCVPCVAMAPILEDLAGEQAGKLTIAKLDVDQNPLMADKYKVMSIPMMVVFENGTTVKTIIGARPKEDLLQQLEGFVA